jgi:alpha-beta hydrolase superfamily lysophospholipase
MSLPMTDRFTFTRDGDQLVGTLHLPVDRPLAAVVTTGPLTSVKEQATGAYARALAERGFAALAFDHRTFGESEGQPRQLEQPEGKAADVSAAVTALGSDDRTRGLPVLAVGICAGGGYMARAVADDSRVRAFAGESFSYTTSFDAQEAAARLRVPFLLIHSERALAPPLARKFYAAVGAPKWELWLQSQGQIDFYDDPRLIDPAVDAITEHLTGTLA